MVPVMMIGPPQTTEPLTTQGASANRRIVEEVLPGTAAIGACGEDVGGDVEIEGMDGDVGEIDAQLLPDGGAVGEAINAVVGAEIEVVVAVIEDEVPDRPVGGRPVPTVAQVRPASVLFQTTPTLGGADLAADGDVDRVAIVRIDHEIGDVDAARRQAHWE